MSIAPILSDIFLAKIDKAVAESLRNLNIIMVHRFVDDYLILFDNDPVGNQLYALDMFLVLKIALSP